MYNRELIPNFQWIKLPFLPYAHFFLFYVITNWWYMSPNRCWHWNYCNNFFNCFYTISVVKNMSDKYAKMFRLKCLEYNVRISCRIIHKDYWLWDITVVRWIVLQQNIWWNRNSNISTSEAYLFLVYILSKDKFSIIFHANGIACQTNYPIWSLETKKSFLSILIGP